MQVFFDDYTDRSYPLASALVHLQEAQKKLQRFEALNDVLVNEEKYKALAKDLTALARAMEEYYISLLERGH